MRLARCLENCAKDLQTKFERTKEEVLEKKKRELGVGRNVSSLFSMERVKLLYSWWQRTSLPMQETEEM